MTEPAYRTCATLDDYLAAYGEALSERAQGELAPLHNPDHDQPLIHPGDFRRDPYKAQAALISAAVKQLCRDKSTLIDAEQGTGKTLMSAIIVHVHASLRQSTRARGAKRSTLRTTPRPDVAYRALVMCPDHLPPKWLREIEATIPGNPRIAWLKDWRQVLAVATQHRHAGGGPRHWQHPVRPEWYVIGRDCAKLGSSWRPVGADQNPNISPIRLTFTNGQPLISRVAKPVAGRLVRQDITVCPRCGGTVVDSDKVPVNQKKLAAGKHRCKGTITALTAKGNEVPDFETRECQEQLWQCLRRPPKYAPATLIHRRLKGFFDYAIIDEIHECKDSVGGGNVAQANAMGSLSASCPYVLGLTGTTIGGYAWHLFYMLMRICPRALLDVGLTWDDGPKFNERYGKIDTIVTSRAAGTGAEVVESDGKSNKQSKGKAQVTTRKVVRPGIMPGLVPDITLPHTVCLSLAEIDEALPPLLEFVEEGAVPLDPEQKTSYNAMEAALRAELKEMLRRGDRRLLGAFNATLLGWPDACTQDWGSVGYADKEGHWVEVCRPPRLTSDLIRPKERKLIEILETETRAGHQCWVYVEQTDRRDIIPRLQEILAREGYTVEVLRQSVDRRKREAWIAKQGQRPDVMISHPKLVETGLDLFSKEPGGHDYSTIIFYELRYAPFVTMQAGHRHWRLGRPDSRECRTYYLHYEGTAQERCLRLMGKKFEAVEALRGHLNAEGIALLSGNENHDLAMARALVDHVSGPARSWTSPCASRAHGEWIVLPPRPRWQPTLPPAPPMPAAPAVPAFRAPPTFSVNNTAALHDLLRKLREG